MNDEDKYEWKNINLDFLQLYPTIMKSFDISNNEILMKMLRDRERIKKNELRKQKLEKINNL